MRILCIALIIYLFIVVLRYVFASLSLFVNYFRIQPLFNQIDALYKKRYAVIKTLLPDDKLAELFQAECLSDELYNIDRKLALNFIIEQKLSELKISNDSYLNLSEQINTIGKKYNKIAKLLRRDTEIYPASFIARLVKIKSVDIMKSADI